MHATETHVNHDAEPSKYDFNRLALSLEGFVENDAVGLE